MVGKRMRGSSELNQRKRAQKLKIDKNARLDYLVTGQYTDENHKTLDLRIKHHLGIRIEEYSRHIEYDKALKKERQRKKNALIELFQNGYAFAGDRKVRAIWTRKMVATHLTRLMRATGRQAKVLVIEANSFNVCYNRGGKHELVVIDCPDNIEITFEKLKNLLSQERLSLAKFNYASPSMISFIRHGKNINVLHHSSIKQLEASSEIRARDFENLNKEQKRRDDAIIEGWKKKVRRSEA